MKTRYVLIIVVTLFALYLVGYVVFRIVYNGDIYRISVIPGIEADAVALVPDGTGIQISKSPRIVAYAYLPIVRLESRILGTKYE